MEHPKPTPKPLQSLEAGDTVIRRYYLGKKLPVLNLLTVKKVTAKQIHCGNGTVFERDTGEPYTSENKARLLDGTDPENLAQLLECQIRVAKLEAERAVERRVQDACDARKAQAAAKWLEGATYEEIVTHMQRGELVDLFDRLLLAEILEKP